MTNNLRIIVTGLIVQYPLGGVAWDYIQYVLGLKKLGHDVYYFEDTQQWPYNPKEDGLAKDPAFNVQFLSDIMDRYGLQDKWAYCFPHESKWYGLSDEKRREVIKSADILINVSGTLAQPEKYRGAKKLVYIDSDPVFTQIKLARGQDDFRKLIDIHDLQFTFGENLSDSMRNTGHNWIPTRQPVVLSEWKNEVVPRKEFTTIMNWTSHNDVTYHDKTYGQKDKEFKKFIDLPSNVSSSSLELAVNAGKTRRTPYDFLKHKGWSVVDPNQVCPDMESYRDYIINSKAEWSIAKNGYVVGQSGWFSCRSACYLAAGRPVVVQDTGFSKIIPVAEGILAFNTMEEAVKSIIEIDNNYEYHSKSALRISEEYFNSDKILTNLINKIHKKANITM